MSDDAQPSEKQGTNCESDVLPSQADDKLYFAFDPRSNDLDAIIWQIADAWVAKFGDKYSNG